jgi:predicted GNAT family acetyltransferase
MLGSGRKFCFLFTDVENPTSNKIYRQIGYRPIADFRHWIFDAAH